MVEETYSAFEIEDMLSKVVNDLDFAVEKIAENNKKYDYSKDMVEEYKEYVSNIAKNYKKLKKLVNEMTVFDERKSKGAKKIRRYDII